MKKRYIESQVINDLTKKMVLVAGPRQSGKTTFSKKLLHSQYPSSEKIRYLNWDIASDRAHLLEARMPATKGLIVLDEIHKFRKWKNLLKGLFDNHRDSIQFLITGSARLDLFRKAGDSLQGRYHFLRLYPFSFQELQGTGSTIESLLELSAFPEPFLSGSQKEARRWSREYRSRLIHEEVGTVEQVKDLGLMEMMAIRLHDLVGSPLSLNSLREDLSVAHATITRWVELLEKFYFLFRVFPFGAPQIKAVKKEYKHYLFDWTLIEEEGAKFENLIAFHLLKWCHFIEDTEGFDMELRYFRDIDMREVDFVILRNKKPELFVEAKFSDKSVSPHLLYLKRKFPNVRALQVVNKEGIGFRNSEGVEVLSASRFLKELI